MLHWLYMQVIYNPETVVLIILILLTATIAVYAIRHPW